MFRARALSLSLLSLALLASPAAASPSDGGPVVVDGSALPDLSLMPRDLEYPDTECGCTPAPKLLHPDFGLNEASVDLPVHSADIGPDQAAPDAGARDARPRDSGGDLGRPSAELPSGCQLGATPTATPFTFAALALLLLVGRRRRS